MMIMMVYCLKRHNADETQANFLYRRNYIIETHPFPQRIFPLHYLILSMHSNKTYFVFRSPMRACMLLQLQPVLNRDFIHEINHMINYL